MSSEKQPHKAKLIPAKGKNKRNHNNLTALEQKFADGLLNNPGNLTATDLLLGLNTNITRASARAMASTMRADVRIQTYMKEQEAKIQENTNYDLIQWRKDALLLKDIAMGHVGREQTMKVRNDDGHIVEIQLDPVKQFDGHVARAALELIAKQMGFLSNKVELDVGEQLREIFTKVRPTLGPPALRNK